MYGILVWIVARKDGLPLDAEKPKMKDAIPVRCEGPCRENEVAIGRVVNGKMGQVILVFGLIRMTSSILWQKNEAMLWNIVL
ncbi:hypothetical protein KJ781_04475 [Patescibacteria group bacterium]|nr:hypothetical protein [Patescibacteria group bacterium]